MAKRMLIDATHGEETRVVVLDGNRLEDFDVETSTKRQLKGNIYLAKVVRVEPSLQAAFVEYGGNRHGFLAFGEIHPDYYQIPVADRQRLLDMQEEEARREEEAEDRAAEAEAARDAAEAEASAGDPEQLQSLTAQPATIEHETIRAPFADPDTPATPAEAPEPQPGEEGIAVLAVTPAAASLEFAAEPVLHGLAETEAPEREPAESPEPEPESEPEPEAWETHSASGEPDEDHPTTAEPSDPFTSAPGETAAAPADGPLPAEAEFREPESTASERAAEAAENAELLTEQPAPLPPPEIVGGDADGADEAQDRRIPPRFLRNYRIQEVIRRRQILLVQVVKEERGTKGAALTTYLSLAGRYCVLMPNSPRGGGISRKITSAADRRRLKEIMAELDIPKGMGLIVRTAGANRPKPEIKRDCEYLMRLWDDIREHTLRSVAPALIYEEASLIKRAIRDVYSRDIDEVLVDGEEGWKAARDFMRMLMPSHAKKVQIWRDGGMPLFAKNQVDAQLDAMLVPTVQLRSGGYLVINQTEALVAIDVNSGRSTRERNIEETALRTNLEAADEVARQLRLRDLAGLIVIDFIDMESRKHNAMVERRLKEALKNDRARIQVGHISHFGLLEMSRQRLRPSLAETSLIVCPHCGGTGHVRSTESAAIHVLRHIDEEGAKRRAAEIVVHVAAPIAMYILNHKRERLREIELRYAMHVIFQGDDSLVAPEFRIDRVRPQVAGEAPAAITPDIAPPPPPAEAESQEIEEDDEEDESDEEEAEAAEPSAEGAEDAERRRRRRRRRRRGGRRDEAVPQPEPVAAQTGAGTEAEVADAEETGDEEQAEGASETAEEGEATGDEEGAGRGRRRGRRGGRRRRREGADQALSAVAEPGADQPDLPPVYQGPTPANPFGGQAFDIFEVMERAEEQSEFSTPLRETSEPAVPAQAAEPEPEPAATPAEPDPVASQAEPEPAASSPEASSPEAALAVAEPANLPQTTADDSAANQHEATVEPTESKVAETVGLVESTEMAEAAPTPTEVAPEPVIKPIVIGSEGEPVPTKKRGWWRR